MNLLPGFLQFIKQQNLFSPKDKLLLAVSGGVDSVVLCELCHQAGFDFIILHCNFHLRGDESERDELFVRKLGEKYKVDVKVKECDTENFSKENKFSIQEAARVQRYAWFDEVVNEIMPETKGTPVHVLTAHHEDDNTETVLMNFCRGTGLHGLTGIPLSYGHIKRPLLGFTKDELLAFAKENKLDYAEDSSNLSSKYTRNLFRIEIIPAIEKVYPYVKQNLADNINRFKEIEKLYQLAVFDLKKKLVKERAGEWHIPVKQLMGYDNRALVYEIIKDFGFAEKQIDEVIKLADSESGRYIDSPQLPYRLIRHRHWFIISPVSSSESATIIINREDEKIIFSEGVLQTERIKGTKSVFPSDESVAWLDAAHIDYPLLLRRWKTGDYFYPLGMKKKKKLSRFFIDQKLSLTQKEKTWVLESGKRIIWIVGMRIDERCRVTAKTKEMLKISFSIGQTG